MGLEATTVARKGRKRFEGKLHLDSKSLTFRSPDLRWAAELGESISAESKNDLLIVKQGDEKVTFEIGEKAPKWVEKILNPPTRVTKLGIKPEHRFWLSKGFPRSFAEELKSTGAKATRQMEKCDIAFWRVTEREALIEFAALASRLPEKVNIWIVWPKGSKAIGQTDVMKKTRSLGFGPSKTAAFDDDHSSMRFAKKK